MAAGYENPESLLWDYTPEMMPHFDRWDTLNGGAGLCALPRHTTVLHTSRAMDSTEPRYKVFALRSLFPQILGMISVDYTISLARLYTEAMKATLLHEQNLHALKLLQPATSQMLLPSWVPELSFANSLTGEYATVRSRANYFNCSNGSKAVTNFTNDPTQIVLRGCCIDTIETCYRPSSVDKHGQIYTISRFDEIFSEDGDDGILDAIMRLSAAIDGLRALPGFHRVEKHFSGMFAHFKFHRHSERTNFLISQNRERSEILKIFDSPMLIRNYLWQDVEQRLSFGAPDFKPYLSRTGQFERLRYAYNYLLLRAFLITTANQIGSADALIEKGDQVYLFCGADVPYIIRSEGSRHRLMGAARIEGIMDGEAWPADESLLDYIIIS